MSHLFPFRFKLGESQSDILILSPKYTSPIAILDARHTYPKLIEVIVYYLGLTEKQGSTYIHEKLKREE